MSHCRESRLLSQSSAFVVIDGVLHHVCSCRRVATLYLERVYGAQASKKVQDTLVCIVAQEIDHALKK
jgi:hypothetical protein